MRLFGKKSKVTAQRTPLQQSGSAPVFSYYNNRPQDIASTKQRKRTRSIMGSAERKARALYHINRLPTYIASILIAGSLFYATTLDTRPKVLIGKSSGDSLMRSANIYQSGIKDILDNSVFSQNKLTINTQSIAEQIQKNYPEIQEATVSIPLIGRHPVIGLDPAEPSLVYASKLDTYVMAQDGRILYSTKEVAKGSKTTQLPVVTDEAATTVEQGRQALPKDTVTFITTVLFQFRAKNLQQESLTLPAEANQLRIKLRGDPYYIKFQLSGDARVQAGAYLATRDRLAEQKVTPREYVDVRVEDRVYYR